MRKTLRNGDILPDGVTEATIKIVLKNIVPQDAAVSVYNGTTLLGVATPDLDPDVPQDGKHFTFTGTVPAAGVSFIAKVTGAGTNGLDSNAFDLTLNTSYQMRAYDPGVSEGAVTVAFGLGTLPLVEGENADINLIITNSSMQDQLVIMPQTVTGAIVAENRPFTGLTLTDDPIPSNDTKTLGYVIVPAQSTKGISGSINPNSSSPVTISFDHPVMSVTKELGTSGGYGSNFAIVSMMLNAEAPEDQTGSTEFAPYSLSRTVPYYASTFAYSVWDSLTFVASIMRVVFDQSRTGFFKFIIDGVDAGEYEVSSGTPHFDFDLTSGGFIGQTLNSGNTQRTHTFAVAHLTGTGGSVVTQTPTVSFTITRNALM